MARRVGVGLASRGPETHLVVQPAARRGGGTDCRKELIGFESGVPSSVTLKVENQSFTTTPRGGEVILRQLYGEDNSVDNSVCGEYS